MPQEKAKQMVVALTSLILITGLSACSTTPQTVEYTPTPIDRPTLILPPVETLDLKTVDWIVITRDNVEDYFAEIEKSGKPVSFFALDGDGYSALSINMVQLLELVSQQKAIIVAYEDYYNTVEQTLDEQNDATVLIPVIN